MPARPIMNAVPSEHLADTVDPAVLEAVGRLLDIQESGSPPFEQFRNGLRTRAVLATLPGIQHRFSADHDRVVIKLYKGAGDTQGSRGYQHYHHTDFAWVPPLAGLVRLGRIQGSLTAGVSDGAGPYAVLGFVEGEELTAVLARADLDRSQAERLIRGLLTYIWLPLWSGSLRFKDCHPGNFVVTPEGNLVMIDTEQMRKPVRELRETPSIWTRRNTAEATAIARLPGLLQRIVLASNPGQSKAMVLREVKSALAQAGLPAALSEIGRAPRSIPRAHDAVDRLLWNLSSYGWLE